MLAVQDLNLLQPTWQQPLLGQSYARAPSHPLCSVAAKGEMTPSLRVPTLDWPVDLFLDATVDDSQVDGDLLCDDQKIPSYNRAGSRGLRAFGAGSVTRLRGPAHATMQVEIAT